MSRYKDIKIHMNAAIERAFEEIELKTDKWGNKTYVWGALESVQSKELKKSIQSIIELDFMIKKE